MTTTLAGVTPVTPTPLVTYYDLDTAERVELSGVTTANWVAKISNYLVDDLDAEIGTRIRLGLPTHWQRFCWILAAWNVGAVLTESNADIGLSGPELEAAEPIRLAASLRPLGMRFAETPEGFSDIGIEVLGHGDDYFPLDSPTATDLAWDLDGEQVTHGHALESVGDGDSRRLLRRPATVRDDARALLAAIVGGGSLVVITGGEPAEHDTIATQEQAEIP